LIFTTSLAFVQSTNLRTKSYCR